MDESAASKQGRKLSTMRVDPKARDSNTSLSII